jgi:hypothetical protein
MRTLNREWGATQSKNVVGERVKLLVGPGTIDLKRPEDMQFYAKDMIQIRKFYDLVFAITMKSCLADLGVIARRDRRVFMVDNQVMQKDLGSATESKYQQHQSAQDSPYGGFLQQIS